ncbi:MAG TPA: GNAT family N-acetyltransferase, partial [Acidimicrobiales bacterium]|nr:GNAT family N-acetyltransferase [Acidimicrobiales bacterium]
RRHGEDVEGERDREAHRRAALPHRAVVITLRPLAEGGREWARSVVADGFGSTMQMRPGRTWEDVTALEGLIAEVDGTPAGLLLYEDDGDALEVCVILSVAEARGVGTALIDGARDVATSVGCRRLRVFTGNDNIDAIRFYQRRGFDMVALHRDFMDEVRTQKPDVPVIGESGIAMRHMLELEQLLG